MTGFQTHGPFHLILTEGVQKTRQNVLEWTILLEFHLSTEKAPNPQTLIPLLIYYLNSMEHFPSIFFKLFSSHHQSFPSSLTISKLPCTTGTKSLDGKQVCVCAFVPFSFCEYSLSLVNALDSQSVIHDGLKITLVSSLFTFSCNIPYSLLTLFFTFV